MITGIFSENYWWIAPILVSGCTSITGVINQAFNIQVKWVKRLISWIIAGILAFLAYYVNAIQFGYPQWIGVVSLGVTVGVAANGIYTIDFIKKWISTWFRSK